jgi:hypothetical protein
VLFGPFDALKADNWCTINQAPTNHCAHQIGVGIAAMKI